MGEGVETEGAVGQEKEGDDGGDGDDIWDKLKTIQDRPSRSGEC